MKVVTLRSLSFVAKLPPDLFIRIDLYVVAETGSKVWSLFPVNTRVLSSPLRVQVPLSVTFPSVVTFFLKSTVPLLASVPSFKIFPVTVILSLKVALLPALFVREEETITDFPKVVIPLLVRVPVTSIGIPTVFETVFSVIRFAETLSLLFVPEVDTLSLIVTVEFVSPLLAVNSGLLSLSIITAPL